MSSGDEGAPAEGSTPKPEPTPEPTRKPTPEPTRKPKPTLQLGRRSMFFAAAGVVLLVAYARPKLPREQRLRLLLGPRARGARSVRITWLSEGEPLREATLSFPAEGAPEVVTQEIRLPDGDYEVEVEVEAQENRAAARKRVTLGGASTTLDLRDHL